MPEDMFMTPLNFNHSIVGQSILDKKAGIEIVLGYVSGLPPEYGDLLFFRRGLALTLMDKGITQGVLDRDCRKLAENCQAQKMDVLITKSDFPFDPRWYLIGDLEQLFELGLKDGIDLPVSSFLYDSILENLRRY